MIVVSVFYPNEEGVRFNLEYYCKNHIPMVQGKLGSACKKAEVQSGLGGLTPGSRPTYVAIGLLYFDSVEAFQAAFAPHAAEIVKDIPNYTNVQPVIQISDVQA